MRRMLLSDYLDQIHKNAKILLDLIIQQDLLKTYNSSRN